MRAPGKMSRLKFLIYFFSGSIIGGLTLGVISYLVVIPRGGDIFLSILFGVCFGAIFGGPLLASNLEKEK
ncbi:hypothetical protein HY745_11860 [Candidatus Desantisbacteria bacterium]|nr:hypothetical protein [Candidatus Desantisbacteria bacterium]